MNVKKRLAALITFGGELLGIWESWTPIAKRAERVKQAGVAIVVFGGWITAFLLFVKDPLNVLAWLGWGLAGFFAFLYFFVRWPRMGG